jgi:hypothetical protein
MKGFEIRYNDKTVKVAVKDGMITVHLSIVDVELYNRNKLIKLEGKLIDSRIFNKTTENEKKHIITSSGICSLPKVWECPRPS